MHDEPTHSTYLQVRFIPFSQETNRISEDENFDMDLMGIMVFTMLCFRYYGPEGKKNNWLVY